MLCITPHRILSLALPAIHMELCRQADEASMAHLFNCRWNQLGRNETYKLCTISGVPLRAQTTGNLFMKLSGITRLSSWGISAKNLLSSHISPPPSKNKLRVDFRYMCFRLCMLLMLYLPKCFYSHFRTEPSEGAGPKREGASALQKCHAND